MIYYRDDYIILYHGDCREIAPTLGRFDLLLTDPPYGIGAHKMTLGNGAKKIDRGDREWDAEAPAPWVLQMLIERADTAIIWGGNHFVGLPTSRGWLFWDKGTGDNDYADGELAWSSIDKPLKKFFRSWVGANAKNRDEVRMHPTQKPMELIAWCIKQAPNTKTILDPYAGSGTTGRAAKNAGLQCTMIEREERFCETIAKRMAQEVLMI